MFDKVRNNKRFIQVVLAIIIVPFALFGIDAYINPRVPDSVATVGDSNIGLGEFQQALRERQDRLRSQFGADPARLDDPELRRGVIEELVNHRLLRLHAGDAKLSLSNAALIEFIMSVPALQENGKFSRERYEALVAAQGMSLDRFEAQVRQDLIVQQALLPVGNASLAGRLPADRWLAAQLEEREIAEVVLRGEQFLAETRPDAAAIERFYQENRARFETPEAVRVEFLVMSRDALEERAAPKEEEIEARYRANEARFKRPEERQASHILIRVDANAPEAEVAAAREKAERLLAQLKAAPGDFAKLAREHSQDPGSASRGGDLGYFGRGMMVRPFEEATFALKEGEISGVVRSDFGFHIIKLTGIRPEQVRPLTAVRGEIVAELKREAAARLYAELAESFANTVYEQSDSLEPAVERYGLKRQTSDWIERGGAAPMPLGHPKLVQAIFSEDAVRHRRNTEAVDVGGNVLVAARVIDHRPARLEPLDAVSGQIARELAMEMAVAKAVAAGESRLAALRKGEPVDLRWGAQRVVSRLHAPNLPPAAVQAVFSVSGKELPAFVGARIPGGYALYRIDKVVPYVPPAVGEGAMRDQAMRQHYGEIVAQEELLAWLESLRRRYPVKIDGAALERK